MASRSCSRRTCRRRAAAPQPAARLPCLRRGLPTDGPPRRLAAEPASRVSSPACHVTHAGLETTHKPRGAASSQAPRRTPRGPASPWARRALPGCWFRVSVLAARRRALPRLLRRCSVESLRPDSTIGYSRAGAGVARCWPAVAGAGTAGAPRPRAARP